MSMFGPVSCLSCDMHMSQVILIPSVPGTHKGSALHRYGHMKTRAVLAREPMHEKFHKTAVVAQVSDVMS